MPSSCRQYIYIFLFIVYTVHFFLHCKMVIRIKFVVMVKFIVIVIVIAGLLCAVVSFWRRTMCISIYNAAACTGCSVIGYMYILNTYIVYICLNFMFIHFKNMKLRNISLKPRPALLSPLPTSYPIEKKSGSEPGIDVDLAVK